MGRDGGGGDGVGGSDGGGGGGGGDSCHRCRLKKTRCDSLVPHRVFSVIEVWCIPILEQMVFVWKLSMAGKNIN